MSLKRVQWFAFSTLLGSLIFVGSAQATDGINRLISVTQLKAQDANDPPPPPPPPPPKTIIGQFWEGTFQSDRNGYQSGIQIGVNSKSQSYIEQDNLVAMVVHRSVDPDGQLLLIGYDPFENVHVMISTEPLSWSPLGDATWMEGQYQIYRLDSLGRKRVLDHGSLGIIAILIGL
ncbi:MAG: hypothetical protein U0905_19980 [Pirellulales bacterium]